MNMSFLLQLIFIFLACFQESSLEENERLAALGRVWGYLKYHHPKVAEGEMDWDAVLLDSIEKIKAAKTHKTFNDEIENLIRIAGAETASSSDCLQGASTEPYLNMMGDSWLHDVLFSESVRMLLKRVGDMPRRDHHFYVQSAPGVQNTIYRNEKKYDERAYPEEPMRLLALFRYWNVIHYFYPYKYLIGSDWSEVLDEFVPRFRQSENAIEFHLTVLELATRINDGHATTSSATLKNYFGTLLLPMMLKYVEDQTVVSKTAPGETRLETGDIILKIDGRNVREIRHQLSKYAVASNRPGREHYINGYLTLGNNVEATLEIQRGMRTYTVETRRLDQRKWMSIFLLNKDPALSWRTINEKVHRHGRIQEKPNKRRHEHAKPNRGDYLRPPGISRVHPVRFMSLFESKP